MVPAHSCQLADVVWSLSDRCCRRFEQLLEREGRKRREGETCGGRAYESRFVFHLVRTRLHHHNEMLMPSLNDSISSNFHHSNFIAVNPASSRTALLASSHYPTFATRRWIFDLSDQCKQDVTAQKSILGKFEIGIAGSILIDHFKLV